MASSGLGDMEKVTLAMNKVSLQIVEEEGEVKKKTKIDRHCAFCLTLVLGEDVKLCGKCKRRAYCSKECQTADWKLSKEGLAFNGKIHGFGQGHKNWCGLPYGEEDLDWNVAPVEGKGMGIVALRDIPPLYRIMVDGMQLLYPEDNGDVIYHPAMNDLTPLSTNNVCKKFDLNAIATGSMAIRSVGLRFSRTNHSCDANAFCAGDWDFHVLILCSNREIKKGEEICFPYVRFKDIDQEKTPEVFRDILFKDWGIICPPSCDCRDEEKFKMLKTCRELYQECQRDFSPKRVFHKMEKIIEIAGKIECTDLENLCLQAGQIGTKIPATLKKGKEYLEMSVKKHMAIYHPKNKNVLEEIEVFSKL